MGDRKSSAPIDPIYAAVTQTVTTSSELDERQKTEDWSKGIMDGEREIPASQDLVPDTPEDKRIFSKPKSDKDPYEIEGNSPLLLEEMYTRKTHNEVYVESNEQDLEREDSFKDSLPIPGQKLNNSGEEFVEETESSSEHPKFKKVKLPN